MKNIAAYWRYVGFFLAAAAAAGGLSAAGYYYLQSEHAYRAATHLQELYVAPGASFHGIVTGIDPEKRTLTVILRSNYDSTQYWEVVVTTTDTTVLARQELLKNGSVYTGISPLSETALDTIKTGEYATLRLLERLPDGGITAGMIIIGNTL